MCDIPGIIYIRADNNVPYVCVAWEDDYSTTLLSYDTLCTMLGINSEARFIAVDEFGCIGFTCGKREEILLLKNKCKRLGFRMQKALEKIE